MVFHISNRIVEIKKRRKIYALLMVFNMTAFTLAAKFCLTIIFITDNVSVNIMTTAREINQKLVRTNI